MSRFKEFFLRHQWAIVLTIVGIAITILLLTIGFFKTLLFVAIVSVCLFFGAKLDKRDGSIKETMNRIFRKGDEK